MLAHNTYKNIDLIKSTAELYSFQDFGRDDFRPNFLLARTRDADTFMAAWDFWEDRNAVNIYWNPTLNYFLSQNGKFFIIFDSRPSETAVEIFIAIYD